MSLFDDPKFEAQIARRVRQRMLDAMKAKEAASEGGGSHGGGGGRAGLMEHMAGGMDPEDADYYVDISRKDLPDINPKTGKPVGWEKSVHRYKTKKGEPPGK